MSGPIIPGVVCHICAMGEIGYGKVGVVRVIVMRICKDYGNDRVMIIVRIRVTVFFWVWVW